ncbi:hypothetical protein [Mangrovibacterium lignilyticum]|uniref:hypothetical protein n=1 Tax=Mangrovibacterium lignilyticum TaxID=2668052 RepID=UPI0013CFF761|nr:hypothetical protein [Mangrovibacterium lignilyticum]
MKKKLMIALTALSIAVLFSSCGKAPQAEIDAANAAIEVAKTAGADVYVVADFAALQDSMRAVNEGVEAQNGKLFKNFDKVKEQLAVVTEMAAETKTKAEVRKEEVKQEVAALQTEVAELVALNNELVAKAPKGKEGAAALEAIKGDISLIETSMTEVADLVLADNLIASLDKAKAAKEKALAINAELNEVTTKYAKNKKR